MRPLVGRVRGALSRGDDPLTMRALLRHAMLCGAMAALSACYSVQMPELRPPVPEQWRHAELGAAQRPVADLRGWWHAFHDPALDALVERALASNLTIGQACARLLGSRAQRKIADTRYLPYLRTRTDDITEPSARASWFIWGFDASWELGLFGRREATARGLQGTLDASAAELQAARVSVIAEVVRNWLSLRAAQQSEQVFDAIRGMRQQQRDAMATRTHLGLASPQQLAEAEIALTQATTALTEPRLNVAASAQRLAVLLGEAEPAAAWLQPGTLPYLEDVRIDSAPAELLRTRPEILRAEAEVLRLAGEAGTAKSDIFPNVSFGGSIIWSTNLFRNSKKWPAGGDGIGAVGPVIDMPLFDWGQRVAIAHAKRYELEASVLAYRQAVLEGVAEVESALFTLEQQRQRDRQNDLALMASSTASAAVRRRLELRLSSPLEAGEANIAQARTQLQQIHTRTTRGLAYVALFKALGGAPLPPEASPTPRARHDEQESP